MRRGGSLLRRPRLPLHRRRGGVALLPGTVQTGRDWGIPSWSMVLLEIGQYQIVPTIGYM